MQVRGGPDPRAAHLPQAPHLQRQGLLVLHLHLPAPPLPLAAPHGRRLLFTRQVRAAGARRDAAGALRVHHLGGRAAHAAAALDGHQQAAEGRREPRRKVRPMVSFAWKNRTPCTLQRPSAW